MLKNSTSLSVKSIKSEKCVCEQRTKILGNMFALMDFVISGFFSVSFTYIAVERIISFVIPRTSFYRGSLSEVSLY